MGELIEGLDFGDVRCHSIQHPQGLDDQATDVGVSTDHPIDFRSIAHVLLTLCLPSMVQLSQRLLTRTANTVSERRLFSYVLAWPSFSAGVVSRHQHPSNTLGVFVSFFQHAGIFPTVCSKTRFCFPISIYLSYTALAWLFGSLHAAFAADLSWRQ